VFSFASPLSDNRRYRHHNDGRLTVVWKFHCPKWFAAHDLTNSLKNLTIVISFWSHIWIHDGLWITLVRYKVFEKLNLYGAVYWCFTSARILEMFWLYYSVVFRHSQVQVMTMYQPIKGKYGFAQKRELTIYTMITVVHFVYT